MDIAAWVVSTLVLMETVALVLVVARLRDVIETPPKVRRRVLRRVFRLVGVWQISIGALLVVFNAQRGDSVWHSIASEVSLFLLGGLFLLVPWWMVYDLRGPQPGEAPDLADPTDVERWLHEP